MPIILEVHAVRSVGPRQYEVTFTIYATRYTMVLYISEDDATIGLPVDFNEVFGPTMLLRDLVDVVDRVSRGEELTFPRSFREED